MATSVAAIKRYRTAKLARLLTRLYYLHRRGKHEQVYQNVCEEFVQLGGVYVKFLQGVMLRSQVMRRWHSPERLNIFEDLESEPLDIVALLRQELPPHKLKDIAVVQPQPFAAGSFGQVYYGKHVNGQPIVVKVLRPMIRELLKYDLRLITAFTKRFFRRVSWNIDLNIDDALREFCETTLKETDYIEEARFANELYELYRGHPHLVIPKTYLELCTPHIIVQEYVPGLSVAQLVKLHEQGIDPKAYVLEHVGSDLDQQLITLGFEALNGVFNFERIQGDPHPGNIRLLSGNQVGLIDFGIHAPAPREKSALYGVLETYDGIHKGEQAVSNVIEQGLRFFASDLYRSLKKLSTIFGPEGDKNFSKEVGNIAQDQFEQVTGSPMVDILGDDINVMQALNQLVNKGNRFGFVLKIEASHVLRAMQTYVTLVESLGRRAAVIPVVLDRVVKQLQIDHPELRNHNEDGVSISDAVETVSGWLERVAERDPALFQQLMSRIKLENKAVEIKEANND